MNQDDHKQRVMEAMRRYSEAQEIRPAGRQRPLIRRKNNFMRGSLGIMCNETKGAINGQ